jgi:hypothetical protein
VQGHRKFNDAKTRADVPSGPGAHIDQPVANLLRERAQLVARQALQVGWGLDPVE